MIKTNSRTTFPIVFVIYNNGNVLTKEISDNSSENSVVKVTSSYAYDLANQCVSETHNNGSVYNYNYVYTPNGNMTESSLSCNQKSINTKYTYDELNRLTSEEQKEYNNDNLTNEFKDVYSFDDYNNITEKVHTESDETKNSTVVSTYDKTRLAAQTEDDNVVAYSYDNNGNMLSKTSVNGELSTVTEFAYDTFDRTTSIALGNGVTTSFAYNADSDRISKTTEDKVTESILDNGSICGDLVSGNNALTTKVFTADNSVYCENSVFIYNAVNTQGDVISSVSSDNTNSINGNRFNAYGIKLSDNSSNNPIGYRNYYYDSETGLYYLKARYYDPTTVQFTQEDTVQDDNLQYNLYGYCSANPVLYFDPSGHDAVWLQDKNAVIGFGHSGLLLQNKNKKWFHFYWGGSKVSLVKFDSCWSSYGFSHLNEYLATHKIYAEYKQKMVKKTIKRNGYSAKVIMKVQYIDGYEDMRYFSGDYYDSYKVAKTLAYDFKHRNKRSILYNNGKYSMFNKNCFQVSAAIMSESKRKYQKKFKNISENITIPNKGFKQIKSW